MEKLKPLFKDNYRYISSGEYMDKINELVEAVNKLESHKHDYNCVHRGDKDMPIAETSEPICNSQIEKSCESCGHKIINGVCGFGQTCNMGSNWIPEQPKSEGDYTTAGERVLMRLNADQQKANEKLLQVIQKVYELAIQKEPCLVTELACKDIARILRPYVDGQE